MTQPKVSVSVEPTVDAQVRFLRCAPGESGQPDRGLLNLALWIRNLGAAAISITRVDVKVVGSATGEQSMTQTQVFAAAGKSTDQVADANWYTLPQSHLFALPATAVSLRLRIHSPSATDPLQIVLPLLRAASPGGAYRFWAGVRDLRPGEFWSVDGLHHAHGNPAQVHGYDVGVVGGVPLQDLLPGGQLSRNEDYRVWGKPIYAIADGTVVRRRDGFPTNKVANAYPDATEKKRIDDIGDGNGNFFMIATSGGAETVLYAHMIPGSLNTGLIDGSTLAAGTYLGRAGNSGSSTGPHLHIHSDRTVANAPWWGAVPRPMTWVQARAVVMDRVADQPTAAPWVALAGRGVPVQKCAVWPSDSPMVDLREPALRHFTIASNGQVWVVRKADGKVRYAGQPLPDQGLVGVYLDQNPGGVAKVVAVHGTRPYLVGSDDKVWEGTAAGWAPIAGSPSVKRMAVDAADGTLWCVTTGGAIKKFVPASRSWQTHPGAGAARDICASKGKAFVVGTDDQIYQSTAGGWSLLPGGGKGKRIGINAGTGKLWVIGMNDGIWDYRGSSGWKEHAHAGRAREIFVRGAKPYVIGLDDALWCSVGGAGWYRMNVVEPF